MKLEISSNDFKRRCIFYLGTTNTTNDANITGLTGLLSEECEMLSFEFLNAQHQRQKTACDQRDTKKKMAQM